MITFHLILSNNHYKRRNHHKNKIQECHKKWKKIDMLGDMACISPFYYNTLSVIPGNSCSIFHKAKFSSRYNPMVIKLTMSYSPLSESSLIDEAPLKDSSSRPLKKWTIGSGDYLAQLSAILDDKVIFIEERRSTSPICFDSVSYNNRSLEEFSLLPAIRVEQFNAVAPIEIVKLGNHLKVTDKTGTDYFCDASIGMFREMSQLAMFASLSHFSNTKAVLVVNTGCWTTSFNRLFNSILETTLRLVEQLKEYETDLKHSNEAKLAYSLSADSIIYDVSSLCYTWDLLTPSFKERMDKRYQVESKSTRIKGRSMFAASKKLFGFISEVQKAKASLDSGESVEAAIRRSISNGIIVDIHNHDWNRLRNMMNEACLKVKGIGKKFNEQALQRAPEYADLHEAGKVRFAGMNSVSKEARMNPEQKHKRLFNGFLERIGESELSKVVFLKSLRENCAPAMQVLKFGGYSSDYLKTPFLHRADPSTCLLGYSNVIRHLKVSTGEELTRTTFQAKAELVFINFNPLDRNEVFLCEHVHQAYSVVSLRLISYHIKEKKLEALIDLVARKCTLLASSVLKNRLLLLNQRKEQRDLFLVEIDLDRSKPQSLPESTQNSRITAELDLSVIVDMPDELKIVHQYGLKAIKHNKKHLVMVSSQTLYADKNHQNMTYILVVDISYLYTNDITSLNKKTPCRKALVPGLKGLEYEVPKLFTVKNTIYIIFLPKSQNFLYKLMKVNDPTGEVVIVEDISATSRWVRRREHDARELKSVQSSYWIFDEDQRRLIWVVSDILRKPQRSMLRVKGFTILH